METTGCCIVGCGPAGAVLGLMLARAGVDVVVLEKHQDFFRDFRGDTIHPPTLQAIDELGLLDRFWELPHQRVTRLNVVHDHGVQPFVDLRADTSRFPYITYVPQWDFLTMLTQEAAREPGFQLRMRTRAVEVVEAGGRIVGVRYESPGGSGELRAPLTVAADGRDSVVRDAAGLVPRDIGAPVDLLWFQLERRESDPAETFVRLSPGHAFAMLNRGSYWQAAYIVPKGGNDALRRQDIQVFRSIIGRVLPFLADRTGPIAGWDDVRYLQVQVDRLPRWYRPGLLCIGDSAHASSPVGGFGANLAVQDAIAAANLLAGPLRRGQVSQRQLRRVQRRRVPPTAITQAAQSLVQRQAIREPAEQPDAVDTPLAVPDLAHAPELPVPWPLRVLGRFNHYLMATGLRTERVRVGAARSAAGGTPHDLRT